MPSTCLSYQCLYLRAVGKLSNVRLHQNFFFCIYCSLLKCMLYVHHDHNCMVARFTNGELLTKILKLYGTEENVLFDFSLRLPEVVLPFHHL